MPSDDTKRARLSCISRLLSQFPWEAIAFEVPRIPRRIEMHEYDDPASLAGQSIGPLKS